MRRVLFFTSVLVLLGTSVVMVTAEGLEPNVLLSEPTTQASWPTIAADGRGVYVTWQDRGLGDFDILMTMSSNNGTTFSEPVFVNDNPGDGTHSSFPDMAVGNGRICVVWADNRNGASDIYFSQSLDGRNFSPDIAVWSSDTNSSYRPSIAIDEENDIIYVAWTDDLLDIRTSSSVDGGQTFSPPVTASDSRKNGRDDPQIGVDSKGKVHVVWADGRTGKVPQGPFNVDDTDIFISNSTDSGQSFGSNRRVNIEYKEILQSSPSLVIDGNDVLHVVWDDELIYGEPSILYAGSINGRDFTTPLFINFTSRLTNGRGTTHQTPVIEVSESGDTIYVSWAESLSGNYNIYLAMSEGVGFYSAVSLYGGNYFFDDILTHNAFRDPGEAVLLDDGNGRLDPGRLNGTESPDEIVLAGLANLQEDLTGERLAFFDQNSDGWDQDDDIVRESPVTSYPSIEPKQKSQWDTTTGTFVNYLRLIDGFLYDVEQSETMSIGAFDIAHAKDAGVNPENFGLEDDDPISRAEIAITYRTDASYDGSSSVNISRGLSGNISIMPVANTGGTEVTETMDLMSRGFWTVSDLKSLNVSFTNDASSSATVSFNKISLWIDRGIPERFDAYDFTVYDGSSVLPLNQSLSAFTDGDDVMFIDASLDGLYDLGEPLILTSTDVEPGQSITNSVTVLPRADQAHWGPVFIPFPLNDDAGTDSQYAPAIALDSGGGCHAAWSDFRGGISSAYFADTVSDTWPPSVLSVVPGHGSLDVLPDTDIRITFSEPIDRQSLESSFSIFPPTAGAWNWSAESDSVAFEPLFPLLPDTTYHVEISSSVMDVSGIPMKDRFRWRFNTAIPPRVECEYTGIESPFVDIPVTCSVSDSWGVVSVVLSHKGVEEANYTETSMVLISGSDTDGSWTGTIPARTEVGWVNFAVVAESVLGAKGRYPAYGDGIVEIEDSVPPELQHDPVASATAGDTVYVTANASDDVEIERVVLYVKAAGATAFVPHEMQRSGQTDKYFVLFEVPDRNGEIEYYIQATDVGGNTATSPSSSPQSEPHAIEVSGAGDQDVFIWIGLTTVLCIAIIAVILYISRGRRAKD
jgi:hypothetical protein